MTKNIRREENHLALCCLQTALIENKSTIYITLLPSTFNLKEKNTRMHLIIYCCIGANRVEKHGNLLLASILNLVLYWSKQN